MFETEVAIGELVVYKDFVLPDNDQWENRFEIKSETSNRIYVIAQNKRKRHWACSCPGWKAHRRCKHIRAMGLPAHEKPFEVEFQTRG